MKKFITLISIILLTFLKIASASTIFVDCNATGANNGTSWANAYTNLQTALGTATTGDQVWIAAGTYKPGTTRDSYFSMIEGVKIYGGFAGTETAVNQRTDFNVGRANETILSGDLNGDDLITGSGATLSITNNEENCYHVICNNDNGLTSAALLDGVTITRGNANIPGTGYESAGGGMYNVSSSPTLNNVTFSGNSAYYGGGMGNSWVSSPALNNVIFSGNLSHTNGGGIYNESSSPILNNVTISGNSAGAYGGGMCIQSYSPTLNNCIVWGNSATSGGNEIFIDGGATTLNYTCYSNDTNDILNAGGTFIPYNCITSDPQFVDADNGDLRIKGTSPCADSGKDRYNNQPYDIRGVGYARKLSKTDHTVTGTIDIGAYEYQEGTDPSAPIVTTQAVTDISITSATGNGNITSLGVPKPTAFGVCWNTTGTPTTGDSKTDIGATFVTGAFSSLMNGLTEWTTYYVRAYATNSNGTTYGSEVTFTTKTTGRIYVNDDVTGTKSGTSWASAYTSLQMALNVASSGAEIWIAAGTYKPGATIYSYFAMIEGVKIYGGFVGAETSIDQRTNFSVGGTNETILSGDLNNDDVITGSGATLSIINNEENCYHVIFNNNNGLTNAALLDGVTISGGNTYILDLSENNGGGMCNYSSSPTLNNVTFSGNSAVDGTGGGMANILSSPTLNNVSFIRNLASTGGGMFNRSSSPTLDNVTVSGNLAYCGTGGGMCNYSSSPNLNNVTFSGNSAGQGGGMCNISLSSPTLNNIIFSSNSAYFGGGMYNDYSSPPMNNVTLSSNSAFISGGGMCNFSSSPTLNNCIIWGNTATSGGNEIYIYDEGATSLNYTCYCNNTNDIYNHKSTLNADANCITSNPQFVDAANGDLRIKGTSPCADTGNDNYNSQLYDIRGAGYGRKLSKNDHTQSGTIDMGAYEYQEGTDPCMEPTVTTQSVTNISTNSATGNGNITSLGVPNPTAYGVCWNITGAPTTADSITNKGTIFITGVFTSDITGLTASTTYYVRAYARNNTGTAYGEEVSFTTTDPTVEFVSASQTSNSENGIYTITARLSDISGKNVMVPFSVNASGTANGNGIDYTITASPVTIPAGDTMVDITVTIVDDDLVEDDETVTVDMGIPVNAVAGTIRSQTLTITDNDNNVLISIAPGTAPEEGGQGNITVSSSKMFIEPLIVEINVSGTAIETDDYAALDRQFVLPSYAFSAPLEITAIEDGLVEGTETIIVTLNRIITGSGEIDTLASEATLEIIDNDFATISLTATGEIDEGEQGFFNITLDKATEHPFTVTTGLSGTANEGVDFSPIRREVNIPAGLLHVGVQLNSISDFVNEENENVTMELFSATNSNVIIADAPGNMATMTIIDDDPQPGISVHSASASEGAGTLAFSIELSAPSGKTVTIGYETSDTGTATPGIDYIETSGSIEFLPGETKKTVEVIIIDDLLFENDETFNLTIHDQVNATIVTGTAPGVISDNDLELPVATLQFTLESILENSGQAYLKIMLDKPAGADVAVGYALSGSAVENEDFIVDTPGDIVIPAGETADSVLLTSLSDNLVGPDGQLIAILGNISNAVEGISYSDTLIIINQDQAITFGELAGATYGDAPFNLSGSTTSGLDVNYSSSNPSVATISGDMLTITGAGTVTATASQPGNEIYEPAVEITRELTVEKAKLQVTANDVEKTYNKENPEFTLSYSGFVNSDNESVLDTSPIAFTTATYTSDAGIYTITVNDGNDNNYYFIYINGTLTINKAGQAITFNELPEINIGDSPVLLSASASSGLDVYFESSDESVAYIEGTRALIVGNGETIIIAQQDGNGNYLPAEGVTRLLVVGASGIGWPIAYGPLCYPNPFSDEICLNAACGNDALVQVFDTNGKKLMEKTCPTGTIYCGTLRNGPYLLKVTLQNGESFSRLVVKE
ncbi:MAG: hypothetical protein JW798_02035 [Prolixibacteraceae bacterium]|nr:hypothetical protein [Prolixibacteraceae bacterium]